MSSIPNRIHYNRKKREEFPENFYADPTNKECPTEDILLVMLVKILG
jgi:hypothetical protein